MIVIFSFSPWPLAFFRALAPAPVSFSLSSILPAAVAVEVTDFKSLPEAEIVPGPGTLTANEALVPFATAGAYRESV